jgi:DNA-binding transcriptional regulator LsrR (DeoR family)
MERLSMRKIREYLRLRFEAGLSARQIAASLQVSRSSVGSTTGALPPQGCVGRCRRP